MRIEPSIRENDAYMPAIWRILASLLCDESVCQADLRGRTGLSHPVVVQQVAQLRRAGLIQFGRPQGGSTGRPRVPITFNWDYRRLLVAEVQPSGITLQATNLAGALQEESLTVPIAAWTQAGVTQALIEGVSTMLGTPGSPWAGIGLVVPATISADRDTVIHWMGIPAWSRDAFAALLSREYALPVVLYHEAEALARAVWAEADALPRSIMAISLRQQSRAMLALISSTCDDYAPDGAFGAIGHIQVEGSGEACPVCRGTCLDALLHAAARAPAKRPAARQALARIVTDMVMVFNPGHLVLQGDPAWSHADEALLRETLSARAYPDGADLSVSIVPSRPRENLRGAASALAGRLLNLRDGQLGAWATTQD